MAGGPGRPPCDDGAVTVLHMGALHPYETALTLVLAFGPFVLLAVVLWLRRREDDSAD